LEILENEEAASFGVGVCGFGGRLFLTQLSQADGRAPEKDEEVLARVEDPF
jgi:hypothetical protein